VGLVTEVCAQDQASVVGGVVVMMMIDELCFIAEFLLRAYVKFLNNESP